MHFEFLMLLFLNKFISPISTTSSHCILFSSCLWFCIFASLVFSICSHLQVCFLVRLLSLSFFVLLITLSFFSFCECEFVSFFLGSHQIKIVFTISLKFWEMLWTEKPGRLWSMGSQEPA